MSGLKYYMPGLGLIGAALLIIVFPQILVALVASLVMMAGIGALWVGKMVKTMRENGWREGEHGGIEMFFRDRWF